MPLNPVLQSSLEDVELLYEVGTGWTWSSHIIPKAVRLACFGKET